MTTQVNVRLDGRRILYRTTDDTWHDIGMSSGDRAKDATALLMLARAARAERSVSVDGPCRHGICDCRCETNRGRDIGIEPDPTCALCQFGEPEHEH